jgi:periplasmic divalent cation tolerance protein
MPVVKESEMEMDYAEGDEIHYAVIMVTAANLDQAKDIAHALVEEEIVACVNILQGMLSIFRWKGKIEEGAECLLIIKTRLQRLPDVIGRVKALHSYDVPEIIALPIIDGNPAYLQWIEEVT